MLSAKGDSASPWGSNRHVRFKQFGRRADLPLQDTLLVGPLIEQGVRQLHWQTHVSHPTGDGFRDHMVKSQSVVQSCKKTLLGEGVLQLGR